MGVAVIAFMGALLGSTDVVEPPGVLLSPEELAEPAGAWPAWARTAFDAGRLAQAFAAMGGSSVSMQSMTSRVSNITITVGANGAVNIRTGDISTGSDEASGLAGIQTININTGFASSVQGATSVAVGSLTFGPQATP